MLELESILGMGASGSDWWGVAGIPGGPPVIGFAIAGGFLAGAGGYSLFYWFEPNVSREQFERNYRTLPGKYQ